MTHYLSDTAIDLPFVTKHDEGEPSRDSEHPRYDLYSRYLISLVKHG
jgi:hypothetical protein